MITVSNTEVTMYNTCQRQHYYRFGLQIEPKFHRMPHAIIRGLVGHSALDAFYTQLQQGSTVEQAKEAAFQVLTDEITRIVTTTPEEFEIIQIISDLRNLLDGYIETYRVEPFEVLDIECKYTTPVDDGIEYAMRLDLFVQMTKGEFKGDKVVVDHKFVYNFKTAEDLLLDGQLAKYVKTVRANGHVVSKGMFNQIRYRQLKKTLPSEIYRRSFVKASKSASDRIWAEQRETARKIAALRALPLDIHADTAIRNLNPFVCKGCYFKSICHTELEGQDPTQEITVNYQPNTYGYEKVAADNA